ncbi:calcium-binding protein [Arsenophonus sp. aPb]|uniref:calcium-binding protein n=1 Tax=Arsenophonus sp. aPb TaxID=3041619 RepID=UPI00246833DC|nr:calcium-binding protein [Arsenophonus sp. aPb]WGL97288.1 calcium-binding protein [Arsenophonus sp. aPb]
MQTADGFLLSMNLTDKIKIATSADKIFDAIYINELDKNKNAMVNSDIEINLKHNSIKNYRKNYILPNMINPLLATHNAQNVIFHGNNDNNQFLSIKNNTYINLSHGIDTYIIGDIKVENSKNSKHIIFDFNELKTGYTGQDIITIVLKNYSGHDFFFYEDKLLYSKDHDVAEIKFINNIDDFNGKIYLIDQNSESFTIEYKNSLYSIKSTFEITTATENNDNIVYSKRNITQRKIDGLGGDDIITDMTELGNILIGGTGNDIITAKGGHNVIVDGSGNDIISLGDGNDIIISMQGNNIISAGKGNNIIVINYDNNDTKVFLNEGENKIFIQGIGNIYRNEFLGDNLIISSLDDQHNITIYDYNKYKNNLEIDTTLNNGILLNHQNVDLLISTASAFKQNNDRTVFANLADSDRDFLNQIYQYSEMSNL